MVLRFAAGKHQAVWVGKGIREERKKYWREREHKQMNAPRNEWRLGRRKDLSVTGKSNLRPGDL